MDCPRFELISKYTDESLIPHRATEGSAGYDFVVAEDTIVPSYNHTLEILEDKILQNGPARFKIHDPGRRQAEPRAPQGIRRMV